MPGRRPRWLRPGRVLAAVLLLGVARGDGPQPLRNADGSCRVFQGSHWDFDISTLAVHNSSA